MQNKEEKVWHEAASTPLRCPVHELPRWNSPSRTDCSFSVGEIHHNELFWYHKELTTHAELWLSMSGQEDGCFDLLRACVTCSTKHEHFLEVCCCFLPRSRSHLSGNAPTIFCLLYTNKATRSHRHLMPVSHFLPACRCVSSLQPIHLFCLWPFSRFPWYLCSLKSSASLCSATRSIVNTSKTVQTVG